MKGRIIMAKNTETTQERNDQAFRNSCNEAAQERVRKIGEQVKETLTKAAEAAERNRKRKQACEVLRCFLASIGIVGLYLAETAGLISSVLTTPVYAIAFVYIGWHACKVGYFGGRK